MNNNEIQMCNNMCDYLRNIRENNTYGRHYAVIISHKKGKACGLRD